MNLDDQDDAPLSGLRVIEVSSFVAAPLGGMTLAQLGAEVIRIDPLGGAPDTTRWPLAPGGGSLYWAGLNKGKRSVTLDLRSPEGQRAVADLVASSGPDGGIVLTNAGYPWLSCEALRHARPDLIHLRITGWHDGSPAVDYTVNAGLGFPLTTGDEATAGPVNHVLPAWDAACGLYAAIGILAAERHRRRTGAGREITLPLADVALAVTGHLGFLAEGRLAGAGRPRIGNHLYGGFARDFRTGSGDSVLVVTLTARRALVQKLTEPGVFGLTIGEEYGGLGESLLTYALVVEELSRGWMSLSGILNTHFIVAYLVAAHGTRGQREYFLPRMATCEIRSAFSMSEPGLGSDVAAIRTAAVRGGGDYVITGDRKHRARIGPAPHRQEPPSPRGIPRRRLSAGCRGRSRHQRPAPGPRTGWPGGSPR